jgi:oxygen-dependent protoporphyrinogen oxidase
VAGLATALAASDRAPGGGLEVRVLEAAPRPGGNLRSERTDGYTVERGPNGFLDNVPATLALVRRLGLESDVQPADAAARSLRRGRLRRCRRPALLPLRLALSFPALRSSASRGQAQAGGARRDRHAFAAATSARSRAVLVDAMVSGSSPATRALSLERFPKIAAMEAARQPGAAMLAGARARSGAQGGGRGERSGARPGGLASRPGGP